MGRYVNVNDVGTTLRWKEGMSGNNDGRIDSLIPVCETRIDNMCGRKFDLDNNSSQRWFEITYPALEDGIEIDDAPHDLISEVVIRGRHPDSNEGANQVIDMNRWVAEPLSRHRNGQEWPADAIRLLRDRLNVFSWDYDQDWGFMPRGYGEYPFTSFPGQGNNVIGYLGVTARWGWSSVPEPVREATVLMVNRMCARLDSPLGTEGSDMYGRSFIRKFDPDIQALLGIYSKIRMI